MKIREGDGDLEGLVVIGREEKSGCKDYASLPSVLAQEAHHNLF